MSASETVVAAAVTDTAKEEVETPSLKGKARFIYTDGLVGASGFNGSRLVQIRHLQSDADGSLYGYVSCVNPETDKHMGSYNISSLVPDAVYEDCVIVLPEEQSIEDRFQAVVDQRNLQQQIDDIQQQLKTLCRHLNAPLV